MAKTNFCYIMYISVLVCSSFRLISDVFGHNSTQDVLGYKMQKKF